MDAIRQSLYGVNLAPYLIGALVFIAFFALLMSKRVHSMHPRRLWIWPTFAWIIAAATLVNTPPQTGTQVVGIVVLAATGFGIGVLLCLSDCLTHDAQTDAFVHKSSVLSCGAAALIVAVLISPSNFWPGLVFLAGFVSGQSACLWRWSEQLRNAPDFSTHAGL